MTNNIGKILTSRIYAELFPHDKHLFHRNTLDDIDPQEFVLHLNLLWSDFRLEILFPEVGGVVCEFALLPTCDEVEDVGDDVVEFYVGVDFLGFHCFEEFGVVDFDVFGANVFFDFLDVFFGESDHFHPVEQYHQDIIRLSLWVVNLHLEYIQEPLRRPRSLFFLAC